MGLADNDLGFVVAFAAVYVVSVVFAWFLGEDRGERRTAELLTREIDNAAELREALMRVQMELIEVRCELAERNRVAKQSGELFPDPFESVS